MNEHEAYTLNNTTAKWNEDGSLTVQFGGCDGKTPSCLPITPGWNSMVRLYRPRKEMLDGTGRGATGASPLALGDPAGVGRQ